MTPVIIHLPGPVVPKARARVTRAGHAFTPAKTRNYESFVRLAAGQAMDGHPVFSDALRVDVLVHVPVPASWSARKRQQAMAGTIRPASRPDLDNILKAITDGMNGIVYADDAQIVELVARKLYAEAGGAVVTIQAVS